MSHEVASPGARTRSAFWPSVCYLPRKIVAIEVYIRNTLLVSLRRHNGQMSLVFAPSNMDQPYILNHNRIESVFDAVF